MGYAGLLLMQVKESEGLDVRLLLPLHRLVHLILLFYPDMPEGVEIRKIRSNESRNAFILLTAYSEIFEQSLVIGFL